MFCINAMINQGRHCVIEHWTNLRRPEDPGQRGVEKYHSRSCDAHLRASGDRQDRLMQRFTVTTIQIKTKTNTVNHYFI